MEATLSRLRSQQRPTSTAQAVAASPPVPHVQPSLQAQPEAPPTSLAPPQAYAAQPALRWPRKTGQVSKLGSPFEKDGPDDGQTEAVCGGVQGESCS